MAAWATLDLAVGGDVYASDVISVAAGLTGVLAVEITTVGVDDVTPTVSSSLIIAARELATIATEDVTVSSVVLP